MRDDSTRWDAPRAEYAQVELPGLLIRDIRIPRAVLVSGLGLRNKLGPALGWPAIAETETYRLQLRRDRVLEVAGPARSDGWDTDLGVAVSDLTGAEAVFEISGENALALLKRGAEIDLDTPSNSVARTLFGMSVLAYRSGGPDCIRLHVALGRGEALWHALRQAATQL